MSIQVLKPKFHIDECLDQIKQCFENGWTGMGYKTVEFEEEWKKWTGHKFAYFLNSNTAGLHLAVKVLKILNNWKDSDEIISTPITFVSTNHSILYENMKVTFADVDEYMCLDPKDVVKKINNNTKAIMFVGYGGRVGKLDEIIKICKEHNLKLILDAAHMTGTRVNNVFPGTWDGVDVAVYSFQAVKNLPTGDSGMICFNNEKANEMVKKIAWLGINKDTYKRANTGTYTWKYDVDYLGFKYNGNAIMAGIALTQLKYVDEENERRREIVRMYDEAFKNLKDLKIISANYPNECSYHIYEVVVPNREKFMDFLANNEIYCGVHYRDNTEYIMYNYAKGTCPNASNISKHMVTLPLHMWLSNDDVNKIINTVILFFKDE